MKYSFIIPAYNAEKHIAQCLQSILNQSYGDLEVIIVNDGSTDDSLSICQEISLRDNRVKIISQKNSGPGKARNEGTNRAVGEYVIFIDADDFWQSNNSLVEIDHFLTSHPECDCLNFNCSYYISENNSYTPFVSFPSEIINGNTGLYYISKLLQTGTLPVSPCTRVIKRDLIINHNIAFPENTYSEDIPWAVKLYESSHNMCFINEYIYAYRKEIGNTRSSRFSEKKFTDLFNILRCGVNDAIINRNNCLLSFWAYEWCILVGMAGFFLPRKRKVVYKSLKEYLYLLNYTDNPKVRLVKKMKSVLPIALIFRLLWLYIKRTMS